MSFSTEEQCLLTGVPIQEITLILLKSVIARKSSKYT